MMTADSTRHGGPEEENIDPGERFLEEVDGVRAGGCQEKNKVEAGLALACELGPA